MSKTDKTTPYRVVAARGECKGHGYPCPHVSHSATLTVLRRSYFKAERVAVRRALARGSEPPSNQHRHGAQWDRV